MRVTIGELLGVITPREGQKLERDLQREQEDQQDDEALKVLQGTRGGVEIIIRRKKST
jgi:hypothetical protein